MPIARWGCLAFLTGIAAHSFWLHAGDLRLCCLLAVWGVILLGVPERKVRIAGILCLFCLGGWMRFELALPTMSHAMRPLDPKGFAYQQNKSDPFIKQRSWISGRIKIIFPGDEGALLAGMLYGERGLSSASKSNFRLAGMTHLIAVSGSNVSILVAACSGFLGVFGLTRKRSFFWLSLVIVAFVLFVTPQAPVVRAAIMGWLVALAPIVGRIPNTKHLLLVSAVAFTLWRPESLLFDPSFALSFLATLGLMTYGSRVSSVLEGRMPETIREAISSTIGATLLTLPYAMWAFGQASATGILANVFAVPLVPWIMGIGSLALLVPCAPLVLATKGFLKATLDIASLTAALPGSWSSLHVGWMFMVFSYLCLALYWKFASKKRRYPQKNVRTHINVRRERQTKTRDLSGSDASESIR